MRLIFFGSGAFGLPTLERLAARHQIACVVTQPDKPAGRGGSLTPTPIGQWAASHLASVPLLKPAKVNEPTLVERIRSFTADAWVVIAFGQKLSRTLLEGRFAINLHASLLPRWRGAAPINAAILGGDTQTGNSVITLADRMDAGTILGTSRRTIDPLATAGELHDLLAGDGPSLVESVLAQHAAGTLSPQLQDDSLVTIASKLSKGDDHVDFTQKADFVRRQVHALTPWPGVTIAIVGPDPDLPHPTGPKPPILIKLRRVQPIQGDHQQNPGTILDLPGGIVACAQGTILKLLEVQPPGRTAMRWEDFARGGGRAIVPGSRLVPARELA
jgi:methionyl-tRNA formyltransferase